MGEPIGLGLWVWELRHCDGGNVDAIVDRCRRSGVSWLCIKAGEEHTNGQVTPALVRLLHEGGLGVYTWNYCRPGAPQILAQIDQIPRLFGIGVDGHVLDAEIEWEQGGDHRAEAHLFAQKLRIDCGPTAWLADAPWPIVRAHPTYPWDEFGAVVNARLDQLYWPLSQQPFARFASRADQEWSRLPRVPVRAPIGCTVDYTGAKHAPIEELGAYFARYAASPFLSLWSYQHLNAAEWGLLERRAAELADTARALDPRLALVGPAAPSLIRPPADPDEGEDPDPAA